VPELCHKLGGCGAGCVPESGISLACRLSLVNASRCSCNFILEYFLKPCESPQRSSWVTHSSATPPALRRVA